MKINANINALQAARHINRTNALAASSLEKLSSGFKINKVSDNQVGTAISNKMKAQLDGLNLAARNTADGVSLVQTAEGAMSEIHEMLGRMRTLMIQAANDTLEHPSDRAKIQAEIRQLIEAIDSVVDIAEFNKMKLINGGLNNLVTITPGAGANRHDIDIKYISTGFPADDYILEIVSSSTDITVGDIDTDISDDFPKGDYVLDFSGTTPALTRRDGDTVISYDVTLMPDNSYTVTLPDGCGDEIFISLNLAPGVVPTGSYNIFIDEFDGSTTPVTVTPIDPFVFRKVDGTVLSEIGTLAQDGNRFTVTTQRGEKIMIDIEVYPYTRGASYHIRIEDKGPLLIQSGPNEEQLVSLRLPSLSPESLGLRIKNTTGVEGDPDQPDVLVGNSILLINAYGHIAANKSLAILDEAIERVSEVRGTLGAYQNRLESLFRNIGVNVTNSAESLSRLQDTDMAYEITIYTLKSVIMQSGIAMLAQANERPQQLLQLLR